METCRSNPRVGAQWRVLEDPRNEMKGTNAFSGLGVVPPIFASGMLPILFHSRDINANTGENRDFWCLNYGISCTIFLPGQ
jgi:hypothetical protein